jgi:hypothetical protein
VIAVEVVSLLLVAALIVVIFARLGAETLRATSPGALCSHASTGNGWRRSVRVRLRHLADGFEPSTSAREETMSAHRGDPGCATPA